MMSENVSTYGEFLYKRRLKNPNALIRTRLGVVKAEDGSENQGYNFYPTRSLFEKEFQQLWDTQADHYPGILTQELRDNIWKIIFFQRPLKPPKIGLCLFEEEVRLAKAHPSIQK